jgi:hypothetical protein
VTRPTTSIDRGLVRRGAAVLLVCAAAVAPPDSAAHAQQSKESTPSLILTIGQVDGPDEYVFPGPIAPLVAPDGRIVVLDRGASGGSIRVYESTGEFVQRFGGSGSGPGEFQRPGAHPVITPDSQLIVYDPLQLRLTAFDLAGHVLGTKRVVQIPDVQPFAESLPLRHGYALVVTQGTMSPLPRLHDPRRAWILVRDDEVVDSIARFRVPVVTASWQTSGDRRGRDLHEVGPRIGGRVALSGDSLLAVVDGRSGMVSYLEVGADGLRELRRVSLGFAARDVSRSDRQRIEAVLRGRNRVPPRADIELDMSEYWSVASAAFFSDDAHLWIGTHPEPDDPVIWRIIDPSGVLLDAHVRFPDAFRPTAATRDRVIGEYTDDLGVRYVHVYSVGSIGSIRLNPRSDG